MTDEQHETLEDALVHEVWRQDLAAIRRLLAAGANPNRPGRAWSSAIACAGENDETGDIARCLVAAGADINLQDEHGQTPLHWAVDMAIDGAIQADRPKINWHVVGVFLDLGANPQIRDQGGRTVHDWAANYGPEAQQSFEDFLKSRSC
jgi:ankyrin repeat protein